MTERAIWYLALGLVALLLGGCAYLWIGGYLDRKNRHLKGGPHGL